MIGAFAIGYATNHVGLVGAGHLTKVGALGFVPMILAGCYLIFNSSWKLGSIVFTIGVAGSIRMNHIQMTYHAGLILLFYVLAEVVRYVKARRHNELITPLIALLMGTVMSFFINYHELVGLNSFSKDTMRGGAILTHSAANPSQPISASSKTGLGWGYAMKWSEGYLDLLSFLFPVPLEDHPGKSGLFLPRLLRQFQRAIPIQMLKFYSLCTGANCLLLIVRIM